LLSTPSEWLFRRRIVFGPDQTKGKPMTNLNDLILFYPRQAFDGKKIVIRKPRRIRKIQRTIGKLSAAARQAGAAFDGMDPRPAAAVGPIDDLLRGLRRPTDIGALAGGRNSDE
jgi:hypothetical protein